MKKLALLFVCFSACSGEATPTPAPEIARRQWLISGTTDSTQQPGASAATTYFITPNRVNVRQLPDGSYLITFEP